MRTARLLPFLVPLLVACGASRPNDGAPTAGVRYDRSAISAVEIEQARERNVANAFDLVRQARPHWMTATATGMSGSAGRIVVFFDGQRVGGVDALRQISLADVASMRFLSGSEAGARYGPDVNFGAIDVVRR